MWDVIVVGAGPAGATAAKKCAEYGLKTLLLEKYSLPRDKVCSGMVMGPLAHTMIKQEFGEIPGSILTQPDHLQGFFFHVPGIGSHKIDNFTPLSWRRHLDYWMVQAAREQGTELWAGARVTGVRRTEQTFLVEMEKQGEKLAAEARFIIGADGANSITRRSLFPEFEVGCMHIYEECYRQEMDIDREYYHWFYPLEHSPASFSIHQKDGLTVVVYGSMTGLLKPFIPWVKSFMAQTLNFDFSQKPVSYNGCLGPVLPRSLIKRNCSPSRGNALLAGEAAGYVLPVTGEGIGTAIQSGAFAANAIKESLATGTASDIIYNRIFDSIFPEFEKLIPRLGTIETTRRDNAGSLPRVIAEAYRDTLRMF